MKCPCEGCRDKLYCTEHIERTEECPDYDEYLAACDAEQEQARCEAEGDAEAEAQAQYEAGIEAMEQYGGMY